MAKNTLPMPTAGGGILSKLLGAVFALAVLMLVVNHPTDAAHWVTQAVTTLGTAADGLAAFLRAVLS